MKRIILLVLASACFLVGYSQPEGKNKNKKPKGGKEKSAKDAQPMDSAAAMKLWMDYMTPGQVHQMLSKWDGTWTEEITMWMAPGAPAQKSTATAVNRMILGGRYQESRVTGSFEGMPFEGISIVGYDNSKKIFQSSWIDNMGTGVLFMEGPMDASGKSITMTGKGLDPMTGKDVRMRQVLTMIDDNNQRMDMYSFKDGKEFKMMEIMMKRK
jgi:hypothetical protein